MAKAPERPAPPSSFKRWLWAMTAGLLSFLVCWAVGVAITILLVRAMQPEVSDSAEANDLVGDAMKAVLYFEYGAMVSFASAVFVGILVAIGIAFR